jgi:hypothetical protein
MHRTKLESVKMTALRGLCANDRYECLIAAARADPSRFKATPTNCEYTSQLHK